MNSSISSSDDVVHASAWRAWLSILTLAPFAFALVYVLTILIDPYSTGRLSPITRIDIATKDGLYAHAARVRDPTFNAAIIGNSHAMAFSPDRMNAITGWRFVQLSALGLNPREELIIARAFVRHHRGRSAVLLVFDQGWCEVNEPTNRIRGFFPEFLFESSVNEYLKSLMSPMAVEAASYRLLILAGLADDRRRRDGYAPPTFRSEWSSEQLAKFARWQRPSQAPDASAPLPALELLQSFSNELDADARLVIYFTRLPIISLPLAGSPADKRLAACKARFSEFARTRRNTIVVDRMVDDSIARDMNNFGDIAHVHDRIAPILERDVASALVPMSAQ
jgi:hypothetical protein